jgi:peroxiredoxin Q/BCP
MKFAPVFSLPDQNGNIHTLADYKGKWVVVYFYPKDDTPGCTTEACGFRDLGEEFTKRGIIILGISKDSVVSHTAFAQKFSLTFPLLSDPDHKIIEAYGAWGKKKNYGKEYMGILRTTFLINPNGEIVRTYEKVTPAGHPQEILADIDTLV